MESRKIEFDLKYITGFVGSAFLSLNYTGRSFGSISSHYLSRQLIVF